MFTFYLYHVANQIHGLGNQQHELRLPVTYSAAPRCNTSFIYKGFSSANQIHTCGPAAQTAETAALVHKKGDDFSPPSISCLQ
jgi:hypothetical protein